jgi:predicted nucleic acid-binding protein
LRESLDDAGASGNLGLHAEIAAVCREHGVSVVLSEDKDFRRFSSIELRGLDSDVGAG